MKGGIWSGLLDLAARVGPVCGGAGGLFYAGAYATYFWKGQDLSDLAQVFFGLAFGALSVGLGRALKKNTDIIVASEAEKRIQNPALDNASAVPQIQNEIDKQRGGSSQIATLPKE